MTNSNHSGEPENDANEPIEERPELDRSLQADVNALIDDGKTYVEAELAFQKSRISLAANRSKSGVIYILAALAFLHLALIGAVVGGIITLIPLMGPGGATLAVVGGLLIGVAAFLWMARAKFLSLSNAFKTGTAEDSEQ